jgi:hypothetical protein
MNVEIGAKAALIPEKEYINGIAVAVQVWDPALECLAWITQRRSKAQHLNSIQG